MTKNNNMPIKSCTVNKKQGFKYGDSGKCYNEKSKAIKQAQAININKKSNGSTKRK